MAQKQQVKIEYEVAPEITTVVSDQGKLRQIIFNFIAWAVSRSPAGESVKVTVDLDDQSNLDIRVKDNGEQPKDTSEVFDPEHSSSAHEPADRLRTDPDPRASSSAIEPRTMSPS